MAAPHEFPAFAENRICERSGAAEDFSTNSIAPPGAAPILEVVFIRSGNLMTDHTGSPGAAEVVATVDHQAAANSPVADTREISPARSLSKQRWLLVRDVVVFQTKLFLDGLRDLVLSPMSLIAALAGLVSRGDNPRRHYDEVMRAGRKSERWINLFGQHRAEKSGLDVAFSRLEDHNNLGELVKDGVDRVMDGVDHLRKTRQRGAPGRADDSDHPAARSPDRASGEPGVGPQTETQPPAESAKGSTTACDRLRQS